MSWARERRARGWEGLDAALQTCLRTTSGGPSTTGAMGIYVRVLPRQWHARSMFCTLHHADRDAQVAKPTKREVTVAVGVVEARRAGGSSAGPSPGVDDKPLFLIMKRPDRGLLAGLWQFPLAEVDAEAGPEDRTAELQRLVAEVLAGHGEPARTCLQGTSRVGLDERRGVGAAWVAFPRTTSRGTTCGLARLIPAADASRWARTCPLPTQLNYDFPSLR